MAISTHYRAVKLYALESERCSVAKGYLQPNPAVIQRFFPDPRAAAAVSIDTTYFPAAKPANALRIVVMGESSAAGFPYGRFASPGEFLSRRLASSLPDRAVGVINTAMSAVTSYMLLDFVVELEHPAGVTAVNELLTQAAAGELAGILAVETEPLVSSDFLRRSESAVVDLELTQAIGDRCQLVGDQGARRLARKYGGTRAPETTASPTATA